MHRSLRPDLAAATSLATFAMLALPPSTLLGYHINCWTAVSMLTHVRSPESTAVLRPICLIAIAPVFPFRVGLTARGVAVPLAITADFAAVATVARTVPFTIVDTRLTLKAPFVSIGSAPLVPFLLTSIPRLAIVAVHVVLVTTPPASPVCLGRVPVLRPPRQPLLRCITCRCV